MQPKGNYLSRAGREERRTFQRRPARLAARIFYLSRGLRGFASQSCQVVNISEGGCCLKGPAIGAAPQHVYLVIAGLKARVPAAIVNRSDVTANLRFARELPTPVLERLLEPPAPQAVSND